MVKRAKPFLDIPYPGLSKTLLYIKEQAIKSIPFLESFIPDHIREPEDLFYFYKDRVKYRKDPPGIEYIQSAETLFLVNAGRGDCDCFTVISLAGLHIIGINNLYTDIVGRSRAFPKHIYTSFHENGNRYIFDLTNPTYNYERQTYSYIQHLRTNL